MTEHEERYITKSGRVLTDADIEALADEAERGYDVSHLEPRVLTPEQSAAWEEYWRECPTDPAERDRLRRIWQGDDPLIRG